MRMNVLRQVSMLATAILCVSPASATDECLICDNEVVLNSSLAKCFLERLPALDDNNSQIIIADLAGCPASEELSRGVIEALSMPGAETAEPSENFVLTREHLSCLLSLLERNEIILDPFAQIDLDDCR